MLLYKILSLGVFPHKLTERTSTYAKRKEGKNGTNEIFDKMEYEEERPHWKTVKSGVNSQINPTFVAFLLVKILQYLTLPLCENRSKKHGVWKNR